MVQSKTNKFDATATYILAVLCTCLQILAFSLVLASLVAPVPTGNTVSTFLTIKSTNVSDVVTIQLGALGDCLTQNGARRCTSSRMAPDYTPTYHAAGMPNELMATLPDRLPDLPGLLVFVTIATILSFLLNLPATLYQISPRIITRSQKLQAMVPFLVRCSMGFATAAFVFGLSATACLQIYFNRSSQNMNTYAKALKLPWTSSMNHGVPQLWASVTFIGISILAQLGVLLNMPPMQLQMGNFAWA